jgi:hypothetical protein
MARRDAGAVRGEELLLGPAPEPEPGPPPVLLPQAGTARAVGESVILKDLSPLNVLEHTCDHSCDCARSDKVQH